MTNNLEELVFRFRWQIAIFLLGLALTAGGVFLTLKSKPPEFEIVNDDKSIVTSGSIVIEVSGAVNSPGVYPMNSGERVEDALNKAGGLSNSADTEWVGRTLNRASQLTDGQKIYIPEKSEQTQSPSDNNSGGGQSRSTVLNAESEVLVNVNTSTAAELESLSGIGPVYAQKIIDNRPYSTVEDLLVKKVIPQSVYDTNKKLLTVY